MLEFIKQQCITCNIVEKIKNKDRCDNCIFVMNNQVVVKKDFEINQLRNISKSHFFYFLHYPHLNYIYPDLPEVDFLGTKRGDRKRWWWEIHHEDGNHWNDNKWNIILILNTEHQYLHRLHYYNPMKDLFVISSIKKRNKEKIQNGTYHGIVKPTLTYGKKYKKVKSWLLKIKPEVYEINKELSNYFGYSEPYSLRACLQTIVNKESLNIAFFNNGENTINKKWFLKNNGGL